MWRRVTRGAVASVAHPLRSVRQPRSAPEPEKVPCCNRRIRCPARRNPATRTSAEELTRAASAARRMVATASSSRPELSAVKKITVRGPSDDVGARVHAAKLEISAAARTRRRNTGTSRDCFGRAAPVATPGPARNSRLRIQLGPPDDDGSKCGGREKAPGRFIVSNCWAPPILRVPAVEFDQPSDTCPVPPDARYWRCQASRCYIAVNVTHAG